VAYDAKPFLGLVVARSLAAGLPPGPDRRRLLARLAAVPDGSRAPLAAVRGMPSAGPVLRLLPSRRPATPQARYARLPAGLRAGLAALSPVLLAGRLPVPVELASAPHDTYFPVEADRALLPHVRLTVTPALQHAVPHASVDDLTGLARLDGFA